MSNDVNLNLNVSNTTPTKSSSGGKAVVELSNADRVIQKQIAEGLKEFKTAIGKQTANKTNTAIIQLLTKYLKTSDKKSIDESAIKRIVKSFTSGVVKDVLKQSPGKGTSSQATSGDTKFNPDTVINNLIKKLEASVGKLFTTLERKGLDIDPTSRKQLSKELEGAVSKAVPQKAISILNELNSTLNSIVSLGKTSVKAFSQMKTMKISGGKLDIIKEFGPFIKSLQEGTKELNSLKDNVGKLKKDINSLPDDLRESAKGIKDTAAAIKTNTVSKAGAVRRQVSDSPALFLKDASKHLSAEIKKAVPSLENSKLVVALDKFSGNTSDFLKLTNSLESFGAELKGLKNIELLDINALKNVLDKFNTVISNVPKGAKDTAINSPQWDKFIGGMNKAKKDLSSLVGIVSRQLDSLAVDRTIKLDFDTSESKVAQKVIDSVVRDQTIKIKYEQENIPPKQPSAYGVPQRIAMAGKEAKTGKPIESNGRSIADVEKGLRELNTNVKIAVTEIKKSISGMSGGDTQYETRLIKKLNEFKLDPVALENLVRKVINDSSSGGEVFESRAPKAKKVLGDIHGITHTYGSKTLKNVLEGAGTKLIDKIAGEAQKEIKKKIPVGMPSIKGAPVKSSFGTSTSIPNRKISYTQKEVYSYPETGISPSESFKIPLKKKLTHGEESRKIVSQNVGELSKSLLDLQKYMVTKLDAELTKTRESGRGDWQIVRQHADQKLSEYFKLTEGFNKKTAGKKHGFKIADVGGLRRETGAGGKVNNPVILINKFKEKVFNELLQKNQANLAEAIGGWVKRFSSEDISSWKNLDANTTKQLVNIKKKYDAGEGTAPSKKLIAALEQLQQLQPGSLENIYKNTISEIESVNRLEQEKLVRTVSVPAAKLSTTGASIFETSTGSQRVIPKFATYKTGFENMYQSLISSETFDIEKNYKSQIKNIGFRPPGARFKEANVLSENMLKDWSTAKDQSKAKSDIVGQYKTAAVLRADKLTRSKQIEKPSDFMDNFNKVGGEFITGFEQGKLSMNELIKAMHQIGVSAYDVVKSMESVEFENIYQMFQKILEGGPGTKSPLTALGQQPGYSSTIRDFETSLNKLVGRIPIADPSRPRRSSHQENIVNLMSMTSPIYKEGAATMTPDSLKQFIRDLNTSLRDYMVDTRALSSAGIQGRQLPLGVTNISSLGVPESQATHVDEFRRDMRNEDTKYLAAFSATNIKMYSDTLSELAPFGAQFQQLGRNIANTTNAMAYRPTIGIGTDYPSLRSERENKLITGGRYGKKGYGFNVVAELRNTANTFEDQIVISGKLADVLTSVTKTIIQPDKLGRLSLVTPQGQINEAREGKVTDIKKGQPLVAAFGAIEDANKVFQEVLGVPQSYRGRADEALIKDVQKAITTIRGKDLNVQAAKIAEVFINYYGRKFTTRSGSKGVAITAEGSNELTSKQVASRFADKKIKVLSEEERSTAGLGTAVTPKSMGELLAELLKENASKFKLDTGKAEGLRRELVDSGNKFMMSMFTDSSLGVVPADQAKLQQALFNKVNRAIKDIDLTLSKDTAGITDLKEAYKSKAKDPKLFKELPIDMRISSHGAAKRGLQTETLETIMNNVISSGKSGTTVLKTEFDPKTYRSLLGTTEKGQDKLFPSLSEYSKALGFERQEGSKKDITVEILKMLKSRGTKGTDAELSAKAGKLAELEFGSNFYTSILDEFGESRKSLVGPKFVEVLEDPHSNPPWSETDIAKQVKGEKLNIPAFGAYASIFGEQSKFIKQLSANIPLEAKKHWEYLKALQVLNDDSSDMTARLLQSAQKVDIQSLRPFTKSTGKFVSQDAMENIDVMAETERDRVLSDTILDTAKYPGAVNLQIPNTRSPDERESFYVPGALARTTYPEPTIAGERGLDLVSRRLQQIVNASLRVDEVMSQTDETGSSKVYKTIGRIKNRLKNYRGEVGSIVGDKPKEKQLSENEEASLQGILNKLLSTLDQSPIDTRMTYGKQYGSDNVLLQSRGAYVRDFFQTRIGEGKSKAQAYQTTISQAVDQLIGPAGTPDPSKPQFASRHEEGASVLGQKVKAGQASVEQFSRQLNIQPPAEDDDLKVALESLEKAKINYYSTLATTVLGKTGSVQSFLFNRKIPGVMAKAINATVDKTEDLEAFSKTLLTISSTAGGVGVDLSSLTEAAKNIDAIKIEHAEIVKKQKAKGLPVLKQHEIGIPKSYAEKLPTNFSKQFSVKEGQISELPLAKYVKSNLAELLEYRDQLVEALSSTDPMTQDRVKKHIDTDLSPYVETARFPFTGTSSVQPYEAKLLKGARANKTELGKHIIMAPGVPEMDTVGFGEVKKQVEETLSKLSAVREEEQGKELPDIEKIERLTTTIGELDKAISEVIPKYIAHQQKLDFDGDQLVVHSAKTAAARDEIAQHYKSMTSYDLSKGTTAQAFRDEFTYDALIPSTGKYTLAEQQMAFEKKFPEEEGFGFLTKPFLTQNLEYLKPDERLNALTNISGSGDSAVSPLSVLTNLLPELYRNEKTVASIAKAIEGVKAPLDKKGQIDQSAYSTSLLDAIKQLDASYGKVVDEGVKSALFDAKFLNAVGGNLFKINTGPDTEALNRLLKVFETNLGFGGGIVRQGGEFSPSPNLQKRFPSDLNVTGTLMNEELNTMMNELLRVGIQKGLDVKHAGDVPIATEISKFISQGTSGVGELVTKINKEEGAYKDLKEFSDANKKVLERSMGALSTEELLEDAKKIAKGRGKHTTSVSQKSREELKEYIVQNIGFEGFLHELSTQVIEAAYEGVLESIKSWNPDKAAKELQGKKPETYAADKVAGQLKDGGINVSELVEGPLMPLYKFRTSGASGFKQRGIYQEKYGDVQAPELEGMFSGNENMQKEYFAKYKEAKAVAKNLQDSLSDFHVSGDDKGSYSMLLRSSIENIRSDQFIVMEMVSKLNDEKDRLSSDVISRIGGQEPMHSFSKDVLSAGNKKESLKYLEKYGRAVGVPSLGQESQMFLEHEFTEGAARLAKIKKGPAPEQGKLSNEDYEKVLEAYDKDLGELKKEYLTDAILVAQSDMVLKAAKTKASEGLFLSHLFPTDKEPVTSKTYAEKRQRLMQAARNKAFDSQSSTSTVGQPATRHGMPSTGFPSLVSSSGPIPVHIASIAQGVGVFMGEVAGMAAITERSPEILTISKELTSRIERAKEIVTEVTGGLNDLEDTDFGVKYRASALKGGTGKWQISEIKKNMMGIRDENDKSISSSLLGTGIHAKLESRYQEDPKYIVETEKPTRYMSPEAGEISGTMDVIRKNTDGTVSEIIDIKTTSKKNFQQLQTALDKFEAETGKKKATIDDVKKYLPPDYLKNTKLDEIASQLNLYLAAEREDSPEAVAAAHFYSNVDTDLDKPIEIYFKFDESKLKRDVDAVVKARQEVKQEGGTFAKTGSFDAATEIAELLKQKKIAEETVDELIATATDYYKAVTEEGKISVGMASKGNIFNDEIKNAHSHMQQQRARAKMMDDMVRAAPVTEGSEVLKVHMGLISLHQRARRHQQDRGISASGENLKSLHPGIQKEIGAVATEGNAGAKFSVLISNLKEEGVLEGKDINKAWKSYRIAVGDYYIKLMETAKALYKKAESGSVEEDKLYGEYQTVVKKFQNYVKGALGKPTDIYTENSSFYAPDSARDANVFMDGPSLVRKSSAPLGEDEGLNAIFKRMADLKRDELPIPREAVREALQDLTDMDRTLIDIYTDAEKVAKMGDLINGAFDFTKMRSGLPRLREALQNQLSFNVKDSYDPEQLTYLKTVLKELKALENLYINIDLEGTAFEDTTGVHKFPTLIDVPKQFSRTEQEALHLRNIEKLRTHYRRPEMEGGAKKGDVYAYTKKTFAPNNRIIDNQRVVFSKYGEVVNNAKQKVGVFKENFTDLNKIVAQGNRTFSVAIERVVKWGAAAGIVYGGLSYIKDAVRHMTDVETAMARLRMVMNPLSTDFDELRKSAIGFAKQYGVETTDVLGGMKVFAQQGLSQGEVVDRTQTSTLAANVTTLNARDATEALTAAMKIFRTEGDSSMRFLDSWSQVEAKAAITAGDLADAIKKSASAGKNAGFTFDELNGMIAAIGSVTRQTGKEVGTSLRFIFRRLSAEKGPKELQKVGVDVTSDKGALRPGFDILSDLSEVWEDLAKSQKLSIAQAIGGTRQYNQVLVLMDNWDETLKSLSNSMNAKGSAERRNLILMKTYAKQLEQTKAVFSELKIEIGKVVLPSFKTGLAGVRGLIEIINNIPSSIKLAGAGIVLFLGYVAKGASILDGMVSAINRTKISFSEMSSSLSTGFKKGAFELFGAGSVDKNSDLFGLDSLKESGVTEIGQLDSALGKLGYTALTAGRSFNEFLGIVGKDTGSITAAVGAFVSKIGGLVETAGGALALAPIPGPVDEAVGVAVNRTGDFLQGGGKFTKAVGNKFGGGAQSFIENFASQNTGAVKSMAPLLGTMAGMVALTPVVKNLFKTLTQSAEEYKKQQYAATEADYKEIESINGLISEYDRLEKQIDRIKKLKSADTKDRTISLGEYESPLLAQAKFQEDIKKFHAEVGFLSPSSVSGFDEFGNVILNNTTNLGNYLGELQRVKKVQLAMSQMDIASKFVEDLTKVDGIQEWKYQLKELAEEMPLIGELIAKEITVGPKKALEVINKELNRLLDAKSKMPLSTAFDSDIKKAMESQAKVLRTFNTTYSGLNKTLDGINTQGFGKKDITDIFASSKAIKNYDLIAQVEEKYKIPALDKSVSKSWKMKKEADVMFSGKPAVTRRVITGRDIAASKSLEALVPSLSGLIEPSPALTIDKLLASGRLPRNYETTDVDVKTGDYVALNDDFAEAYKIATQQAILKVEGVDKIFLEYFDKDLGRLVLSKQFSNTEIEDGVQAIFPTNELIKRAEEDITKLNTFIVGASAGILGLSDKTLTKRQVDIGERFYSDIPTDVLLQTGKGYDPRTKTFGEQGYKKDYQEDFIKKFYEPLKEYHAQREKVRAEGAAPQEGIIGGTAKTLKDLQDVLKNNSIALQYRAAIEDLNKSLEEGSRTIQKNIALERTRQQVEKETAGFMIGVTKDIDNIDYGAKNYTDLNPQQTALLKSPLYKTNAKNILLFETEMKGLMSQMNSAVNTYEDLKQIGKAPEAFGALVNEERAAELMDVMGAVGGDKGAAEISLRIADIKKPAEETAKNTGIMAAKLDTLGDLKSHITSAIDSGNSPMAVEMSLQKLDKLRKIRNTASKEGDIAKVGELDSFINKSYGKLMKTLGSKIMDQRIDASASLKLMFPSARRERKQEIMGRAFKGLGANREGLLASVEGSKEYQKDKSSFSLKRLIFGDPVEDVKKVTKLQNKESFLDPGKIGKAAIMSTVLTGYKGISIKEDIDKLTTELVLLEKKRSSLPPDADRGGIDKQISARTKEIKEKLDPKKFMYGALQGLSTTAATAVGAVGVFGGSKEDKQKLAAVGVGIYGIMKLLQARVGKEKMPAYFKDVSKDIGHALEDAAKTGKISELESVVKGKIKPFVSAFVDDQKDRKKVTGVSDKEVTSTIERKRTELKDVSSLMEIEKIQKDLVQRMDAGNTDLFRSIEAIIASIAAGTAYGYANKKTRVTEGIASNRGIADRQSTSIYKLAAHYPELVDEYLTSISTVKDKKSGITGTSEEGNLLIDVKKAFEEAAKQSKDPIEAMKQTILDFSEKTAEAKIEQSTILSIITFRQEIEKLDLELKRSFKSFDIKRLLSPVKAFGNVLKGFGGEVDLPLNMKEMSAQQRTFAGASQPVKDVFTNYSKGVMIQEAQINTVLLFSNKIQELETNIKNAGDNIPTSQTDAWKKSLKKTREDLIKVKTSTEATNTVLTDLGTSLKGLIIYKSAIQKLNDTLADISVENAVSGITGLKGYFESMGKLMGGADPLAAIAISPEQERMGSRVGIELINGVSNAMDLELAQLKTSYREASTSKERMKIGLQIHDIEEKYRRKSINQKQLVENEALKSTLQPYVELYKDFEKIKQTVGTSNKEYKGFSEAQLDIKQALKNALTIITREQAIKNLDRERMGDRSYNAAVESLNAGPSRVYQGLLPKDMGLTTKLEEMYSNELIGQNKEMPLSEALSSLVEEPLTAELKVVDQTLNKILNELTGGGTQSQNEDYKSISDPYEMKHFRQPDKYEMKHFKPQSFIQPTPNYDEMKHVRADQARGSQEHESEKLRRYRPSYRDHENRKLKTQGDLSKTSWLDPGSSPSTEYLLWLSEKEKREQNKYYDLQLAPGGRVFGDGGPKEDKVPAYLSNGEYVVNTASAKKLGYETLAYINNKGELPKFADGGLVSSINKWMTAKGKGFSGVSDELGGFVKYMQDKRLNSVNKEGLKGFGQQGLFGAVEMVTRGTKGITDVLSMAEGSGRFLGEHGISGVKSAGSSIFSMISDKLKKDGVWRTAKTLGAGAKDAFTEDVSKGGLGLATILMEMAGGAGIAKNIKSLKPSKNMFTGIKTPNSNLSMSMSPGNRSVSGDLAGENWPDVDGFLRGLLGDPSSSLGAFIGDFGITKLAKNAPELISHLNPQAMKKATMGKGLTKAERQKILWEQFSVYQGKDGKRHYWVEDKSDSLAMSRWDSLPEGENRYKGMMPEESVISKAYPGIQFRKFLKSPPFHKTATGRFDPRNVSVTLDKDLPSQKAVEIFGHELQHAIQQLEQSYHGTNTEYEMAGGLFKYFDGIKRYNQAVVTHSEFPEYHRQYASDLSMEMLNFESSSKIKGLVKDYQKVQEELKVRRQYKTRLAKRREDKFSEKPESKVEQDNSIEIFGLVHSQRSIGSSIDSHMTETFKEKLAMTKYLSNVGEVQSRDTASRQFMSAAEKRETLPLNMLLPSFNDGGKVEEKSWYRKLYDKYFPKPKKSIFEHGIVGDAKDDVRGRQKKINDLNEELYGKKDNNSLNGYASGGSVSDDAGWIKKLYKNITNFSISDYFGNPDKAPIGTGGAEGVKRAVQDRQKKINDLNEELYGKKNKTYASGGLVNWGHATAEEAQDRIFSGNMNVAELRSELAENDRIDFVNKLERMKYLSTYLKENYGQLVRGGDSSKEFNPRTGIMSISRDLDSSGKSVSYGEQVYKSYRSPDKSYRPPYSAAASKRGYVGGLKSSPRITKSSYPKLSSLLDYSDSLMDTYNGPEFKYHEYGKQINDYKTKLVSDLKNEKNEDVKLVLRKKISAQDKALANVDKVMGVISSGGNIYIDKGLRKKQTDRPKYVAGLKEHLGTLSDEDVKRFSLDQDVSYKSLLTQIKQDAGNASSFLNTELKSPKHSNKIVGRPVFLAGNDAWSSTVSKNFGDLSQEEYTFKGPFSLEAMEAIRTLQKFKGYAEGGEVKEKSWYKKLYEKYFSKPEKSIFEHGIVGDAKDDVRGRQKKINDLNEELYGKKQKNSLSVFHNGGFVPKTGPIFAQKDEYIVPKSEAKNMTTGPAAQTLKEATVKVDISSLTSELSNLKLQVEDKELKVEDKILKVEDKEFNIASENIKLDVSEAETRLKSAIESALSNAVVNIQTDLTTGSAGAAAFDQLAQTVSTVSDRLNIVTTKYDEDIKYLEDNMENLVDYSVESKLGTKLNNIINDIEGIRSEATSVGDNVTSQISRTQIKLDETTYLTQQALNAVHAK